jgi:hypothetical protein
MGKTARLRPLFIFLGSSTPLGRTVSWIIAFSL